jgi:AraC-like DNA-binding protein
MEYLRYHRLQQAALLLASNQSVSQIAARSGFDDASHFSRAFKAHFGTSPNIYRAHLRAFGNQTTSATPLQLSNN